MISEAKRRANNKYDLANYTVLGCKIPKAAADQFRDECKRQGTTPNEVFKDAIINFMRSAGSEISFKVPPKTDHLQSSQDVVK